MKTSVVIFPFDLFGGGGAAAGAQLLADALKEMQADNESETLPTRAALIKSTSASRNSISKRSRTTRSGKPTPGERSSRLGENPSSCCGSPAII